MSSGAPPHLLQQSDRLLEFASRMTGLDEEFSAMRARLEAGDLTALRIGLRRILEGLFRHMARELALYDEPRRLRGAQLHELLALVLPKVRDRVDDDFGTHVGVIQDFGNTAAHFRGDDVYKVEDLRPAAWPSVSACFAALEHVLSRFLELYPPPATAVAGGAPGVDEAEPPGPAMPRASLPSSELGSMNAATAAESSAIRDQLATLTGYSRQKVTRRLRAVHGNMLLRNVFPGAFEPVTVAAEATFALDEPVAERSLDYESIGECTLRQVRDLEIEEEVAKLAGVTRAVATRRMGQRQANALVRRVFPEWYDASVIAGLTARTARDFGMAPLLARHLSRPIGTVKRELNGVAGQTKLGTVFALG